MTRTFAPSSRAFGGVVASVAVVALLLVKMVSYFNPYATILPDEHAYMVQSFFAISDLGLGNAAFSLLSSASLPMCGEDMWYTCTQAMNLSLELGMSALLGMWVWNKTKKLDLGIVAFSLALFGPFVQHGGKFMPDTLFAFAVALTFLAISLRISSKIHAALLIGAPILLALLTKPHGIVLVVAVALVAATHFMKFQWSETRLAAPILWAVLVAVTSRVAIGYILYGMDGLNLFAGYSSSVSQVTRLVDPIGGLLAVATNLAVGSAVLVTLLAAMSIALKQPVKLILGNYALFVAVIFASFFILLSSAFAGYLEFFELENTAFRALTRYWEFTGVFLAAAAIVQLETAAKDNVAPQPRRSWTIFLIVSAGILGLVTALVPQRQVLSDSVLLVLGNQSIIFLVALGLAWAYLSTSQGQTKVKLIGSSLLISALTLPMFYLALDSTEEKAGYAAGLNLRETLKFAPEDRTRVFFIGDTTIAASVAFTARVPNLSVSKAPVYSSLSIEDVDANARWVVASKEVYFEGEYFNFRQVGDVSLYEVSSPVRIPPWELESFGYLVEGSLRHTFWGSWLDSGKLALTIPSNARGNTLRLDLVANEELDVRTVKLDWDDDSVMGELLPNQEVTPVDLMIPDGSWAGKVILISYLGDYEELAETQKGVALGFAGVYVYQSKED